MPHSECVQHWHVYGSLPGCLPDSEPYTTDDPAQALDHFAHLIIDWAEAQPDDQHQDAGETAQALEIAARCCWCEPSQHADHNATLAQVTGGEGLCEYLGGLFYVLTPCCDADCLKYCPDPECGTTASVSDSDHRCWCCGAVYVAHDACAWII